MGASRRSWLQAALAAALGAGARVRAEGTGGDGPLRVVASFSILGDIARQVGGNAATVVSLVGPNSDAHVFEPTPVHAQLLARAQLVVVNGLGFEGWIPRLIAASGCRGPIAVASDGIASRSLGSASDPHVWQDLANGRRMASNVAFALQQVRPAEADVIGHRFRSYDQKLADLDRSIRERFDRIPRERRRILTSHDAFGYFGAAYGVDVLAPLPANNESEPSAERVGRLIAQMRSQAVRAVFIENISDPRLVNRMAHDAGAVIGGRLFSDALSAPDGDASTYLALVEYNARTILKALGG